jgi:ABC-type phosphate transport system permease subunit
MSEIAPILVLLLLVSVFSWWLVFKRSARDKVARGAYRLYRLEKQEQKDAYDAIYLAGALVMALVFTIFFFGALIASIVNRP